MDVISFLLFFQFQKLRVRVGRSKSPRQTVIYETKEGYSLSPELRAISQQISASRSIPVANSIFSGPTQELSLSFKNPGMKLWDIMPFPFVFLSHSSFCYVWGRCFEIENSRLPMGLSWLFGIGNVIPWWDGVGWCDFVKVSSQWLMDVALLAFLTSPPWLGFY